MVLISNRFYLTHPIILIELIISSPYFSNSLWWNVWIRSFNCCAFEKWNPPLDNFPSIDNFYKVLFSIVNVYVSVSSPCIANIYWLFLSKMRIVVVIKKLLKVLIAPDNSSPQLRFELSFWCPPFFSLFPLSLLSLFIFSCQLHAISIKRHHCCWMGEEVVSLVRWGGHPSKRGGE